MQLSDLERKVLLVSQLNRRRSIDAVASLAGCKPHQARYALSQLADKGVIRPYTLVNYFLLGILEFAGYFSLAAAKGSRESFVKHIVECSQTSWIFELGGRFQYQMNIRAATPADVQTWLQSIPGDVGFTSKLIGLRLGWYNFPVKYLWPKLKIEEEVSVLSKNRIIPIDAADCLILKALSRFDAAKPSEIAREVGLPVSTVNFRIKRLEQHQIISGYAYWVDSSAFGATNYRLIISERGGNPTLPNRLLQFCRKHPHVVGLVYNIGAWDFEIRVEVFEVKQVNDIVQELYDAFEKSIESIESFPVMQRLKTVDFPGNILGRIVKSLNEGMGMVE